MKHVWLKIGLVFTAVVLCSSHLKGSLEMTQVAQSEPTQAGQQEFEFRPQVVQLQGELLNCQARGGIRINFKGTDLMPNVSGNVKAKSSQGSTSIEAKFENLPSPTTLGEQYMTYVLWTMTAKDRPVRIGELEVKDSRGSLNERTALQVLALFVTVEPYLDVSQPSNLVVLEQIVPNEVLQANTGIMAKADLLRDAYGPVGYTYEPMVVGIGQPLIFRQALNARRIAKIARAEQYAPAEYKRAESLYQFVIGTVLEQKKPGKGTLKSAVAVIREYETARAASIAQQNRIRLASP
jgi:hypothetical protein